MRTVGMREVKFIRDVLDVNLNPDIPGQVIIGGCIQAMIAREHGAVSVVDVTFILPAQPNSEAQSVRDFPVVPDSEHVLG